MEPVYEELSLEQAADSLGVSLPYVTRLLGQGQLPYREVAGQHRIRYAELVQFRRTHERDAVSALAEMTAEAQALGLHE